MQLSKVRGWGKVSIDAGFKSFSECITLGDDVQIFGAKLATHNETDFAFSSVLDIVQHGSQSTGDGAEDTAIEKSSFTIVTDCTFERRNVKVSDGVVGVAGVADAPRVGGEKHRRFELRSLN